MVQWSALIVSPDRAFPVTLGVKPTSFGDDPAATVLLQGPGISARLLSLHVRGDAVVADVARGAIVTLNDLPQSGSVTLSAGDELRAGDFAFIVFRATPPGHAAPMLVSYDALHRRLQEELARAQGARPLALGVIALPGLNVAARDALTRRVVEEVAHSGSIATWAELAPDLLAVVVPETPRDKLAALFRRLPTVAGPRARVAVAHTPDDGDDADALLEAALDALAPDRPPIEPLFEDASMVRLRAVAERLSSATTNVLVVGTEGSGRLTLARLVAGGPVAAAYATDKRAVSELLSSGASTVAIRNLDSLTEPERVRLISAAAQKQVRLVATARTALKDGAFPFSLVVPSLVARPDDVLPLAESWLAEARARVGRPRLVLAPDARRALTTWRWPGNVRELKNVLLRAAKTSFRDEVGADSLPAAMSGGAPAEDFRAALRGAERQLFLEALSRSRWNVTVAAQRLGMPRRTVVYRLKKLGLKRPAR